MTVLGVFSVVKKHFKTRCICHQLTASQFMDFVALFPSVQHDLLKMAMQEYRDSNTNFQFKQKGLAASHVCQFILSHAQLIGKISASTNASASPRSLATPVCTASL